MSINKICNFKINDYHGYGISSGLVIINNNTNKIILGCALDDNNGKIFIYNISVCPYDDVLGYSGNYYYPLNQYNFIKFGSSLYYDNKDSFFVSSPGSDIYDQYTGVYRLFLNDVRNNYRLYDFSNHKLLCNCSYDGFGSKIFVENYPDDDYVIVTLAYTDEEDIIIVAIFYKNQSVKPYKCQIISPPPLYCQSTKYPVSLTNLGIYNNELYFVIGCTSVYAGYLLFYTINSTYNIKLSETYQGPGLMPSFGSHISGIRNSFHSDLPNLYVSTINVLEKSCIINLFRCVWYFFQW